MLYRRSPVGVVLRRPSGEQQVVKTGPGLVVVVGEPGEIVLHAFGRDARAGRAGGRRTTSPRGRRLAGFVTPRRGASRAGRPGGTVSP